MTEKLVIFKPGDRFATMNDRGEARIFQVNDSGHVIQVEPAITRDAPNSSPSLV
jgi:hypothetical protein